MISTDSRRWWALIALALSLLVVGMDATIINIALPTLSTALHASTGDLQWFADAYNLVFAAGLLGDRFGRKKVLLIAILLGVVLLSAFGLWEQRLGRRAPGHALVDLALFRSAGFTWGAILATVVSFALFGVLFAIPQFFEAVNGTDALGTGLRLLPIIVGLLIGARVSARLVALAGAKVLTAIGFAFLALGLVAGATTSVTTGYGFAAAWITLIGIGLGFALPTTMNAALGTLSADRSGVGSALISAMRQVGGAIGVAILGTVLSSAYRDRLNVAGLPAAVADPVRQSVSAGVATAHAIGSAPLLRSVRDAFVHGMDVMLLTCCEISLVGIVLTLAFLPRQSTSVGAESAEAVELVHEGVA